MNFIDIIVIGALIYYLFDGYKRGFLNILMELVIFLVSIMAAFLLADILGPPLLKWTHLPKAYGSALGFLVVWFTCQTGLMVLKNYLSKFIPEQLSKSRVNKVGGVITSFIRGAIFIAIILTFVVIIPINGKVKNLITHSGIGNLLVNKSSYVEILLKRTFAGSANGTLTFMTADPVNETSSPTSKILKPDETLQLGYKTTEVTIDVESENKMLAMVNEARIKQGLSVLILNTDLQKVAREHGKDMFARGYFAHITPDKIDPFQRLTNAGIDFQIAGENLALAPSVDLAENGLMNSAGHRANILEPKFGQIGIGVIDGGVYGKMFVQEFRD